MASACPGTRPASSAGPWPRWPADVLLLPLLERLLYGDPQAPREAFARVEVQCAADDAARGDHVTEEVIAGWGDGLELFRR